jgi:putative transcriptional regulator
MAGKKATGKSKTTVGGKIIAGLQEFRAALQSGAPIAAQMTCRKVTLDIEPQAFRPADVLAVRKLLQASQPLFAQFLGVSVKTVRAWEQGQVVPSHMACRFLDEIRRSPAHWRDRLRASLRPAPAIKGR